MLKLPGREIRYFYIIAFMAVISVPILIAEFTLRALNSPLFLFLESNDGQIVLYLIVLTGVIFFTKMIAQDAPFLYLEAYRFKWKRSLAAILVFACVSFGISYIMIFIMLALDAIELRERWWIIFTVYVLPEIPRMILVAIASAFVQELLFRGFLMRYLRWNQSNAVTCGAIVFSAFVFAFVHELSNPIAWADPNHFKLFIGLFILGCALCVIYLCSGSLMVGVGLHAGFLIVEWTIKRVALVRTDQWWMPANQDVRTAALVWILFTVLAVLAYFWRNKLSQKFSVEPVVVSRTDLIAERELPQFYRMFAIKKS